MRYTQRQLKAVRRKKEKSARSKRPMVRYIDREDLTVRDRNYKTACMAEASARITSNDIKGGMEVLHRMNVTLGSIH